MSHVASVKAYVTDLEALEAAAERLGLVLERGAKSYAWFGRWMNDYSANQAAVMNGHDPASFGKCEHKLRRKDAQAGDYEIGLVPRLDGGEGWELLYDNWGSGGRRIHEAAGDGLGLLKQEISAEVSMRQLSALGYSGITREQQADGTIRVSCFSM